MTEIDRHITETILLAAKYPTIRRVGIFGSYAKGNISQDSDIDLIYDYDYSKQQSTDELLGYIEEINDILISYTNAPKIDYVWYKGVLESHNTDFRDNLLEDVIWLYQKEPRENRKEDLPELARND